MTSKCKYAADGTPCAEVRMLNAENYSVAKCLNIASKPEQGLKDFTFCFKDGTSATFKNAGSLQEFLDKLARFHELEKKLKIARKALKDARIFADAHCIASAVKTIDKALEQIEHKVKDNE